MRRKGRFMFLFLALSAIAVPSGSWARVGVDYQMQLGNPSAATADATNHEHYLIQRVRYALDYNDTTHQANWVSWSYTTADTGSTKRQDSFRADASLPIGFLQIGSASFDTGYDRGHMCPSGDRTASVDDNDETFLMSNMIPQASRNNQGLWATFEGYCRGLASGGSEILITCGPGNFGTASISNGMKLPGSVWKVVVVSPSGTALAPDKVTTACRVIAINTPNAASVSTSWTDYITTVEEIEAETGFQFFSSLPTSVARYLRKVRDTGSGPNTPTVISAISPTSGTAGSTVTISGYNFGSSPVVKFNGVTATASVQGGGTQINATVPASATTGLITVTSTSNGTDTSAETFSVSSSLTPSLTLSASSLTGFTSVSGAVSASQSYTVSGSNLTSNVVVTAPTGYEVSLDNSTFASSKTLVPASGSLSAVAVYVRLSASASTGTVSGTVSQVGGGATTQNLTVSGTVSALTPVITLSASSLSGFKSVIGTASASQSYTLSGSNLTSNVVVTAPTGYEVSLDNSTFSGSKTLVPTSGSLSGVTVYVRLSASAATGVVSGTVVNAGGGVTTQNLTVSGNVEKATPTINVAPTASSIVYGQSLSSSILIGGNASVAGTFTWVAPNIVPALGTSTQSVIFNPTDTVNYNAVTSSVSINVNVASATLSMANLSQTYDGSAKSVMVTTVPAGLAYTIRYNGSASSPVNSGSYSVVATVSDPNYSGSATATLAVGKATPIIATAPTASSITYGQSLSNSVLSGGQAKLGGNVVAGTFAFTTPSTQPLLGTSSQAVMFTPSDTGNYNGIATSVSVTVNPVAATMTLSASSLSGFKSVIGTASASQSYTLSGSNLTSNVVVTAPTGYEVSLDNSTFGESKTLVPKSGSLSGVAVYVRLSASAATGTVGGTVANVSGVATTQSLAVSGTVVPKSSGGVTSLANWTFETSAPRNSGPFYPEAGTQTATAEARCVHASSSTEYLTTQGNNAQGNGSAVSFWANTWAVGDYYEFRISTVGISGIQLSFDQTSSGGGPRDFKISYSINGGASFSDLRTYAVPTNSGAAIVWYPTPVNPASSLSFDLSSFGALNNQASVILRLVCASNTSLSGGSLSSTGSSRVDNVLLFASSADTTPPIISLNGANPQTLVYGQNYADPATASDNSGSVPTLAVTGRILNTVLGSYVLTYTATDGSGNVSTATRTVNVVLNASNSGSADSDGNGMSDLLEYALGGPPTGNSVAILPSAALVGDNLQITFQARTNDPNLTIQPVASESLSSTTWSTTGVTQVSATPLSGKEGFEIQTWQTSIKNVPKKFLKVGISR
jgi:DNA/RNA endonuclease G (NUC1)